MSTELSRRGFLRSTSVGMTAGAAAAAATLSASADEPADGTIKIIGVATSPRRGMTTAASVTVALEAAREVDPERIEVELIDLGGMRIPGELAAGIPLAEGQQDDFPAIAEKLSAEEVKGIIVGSPVYFSCMSALCKAFLDRWGVFRTAGFTLGGKLGGALAVGNARNGGQEMTIQSIQGALFCQEMPMIGAARPATRNGAALVQDGKDSIESDEVGKAAARALGRHIAEIALRLPKEG